MTEPPVDAAPWFVRLRAAERPCVRLICFPYAGGGANAYRWLGEGLPDGVEMWAAQLPGRESRLPEPPMADLRAVIAALRAALPVTPDVPFALFGHSMGALLAFELARALRRAGAPGPAQLFLSGSRPPQLAVGGRQRHELSDEAFREELAQLNGTPRELLGNGDLMALMLPALRADFALCDTYTFEAGDPLDCPLTAFAGAADPEAGPEDLLPWAELATGAYALHVFPGDHFFLLNGAGPALAQVLAARLAAATAPGPARS